MKEKGFVERNEKMLSVILLISVIGVWGLVLLIESPPDTSFLFPAPVDQPVDQEPPEGDGYVADYEPPSTSVPLDGCHIEYGASRCIDGNLVTSFYNPGTESIRRVSMYFYEGEDLDIFNCREPLAPGNKGTLTTAECVSEPYMSDKKLEWCCEESCNTTLMASPSDDLNIVML